MCQVKVRSKVKIERFRILVLKTANFTQTGPNSAETLSKVRWRYCMSVNAILRTDQGQGQVTKRHYIQKSHCGHLNKKMMSYMGMISETKPLHLGSKIELLI